VDGILGRARFEERCYDRRASSDFQHGLKQQAADALGLGSASSFIKWKRNHNADFYKSAKGPRPLVLKILVSKPPETIKTEYHTLHELYELGAATGAFTVPQPLLGLTESSAYVATELSGVQLSKVLAQSSSRQGVLARLLASTGTALGAIHEAWSTGRETVNIQDIHDDLMQYSPWNLTPAEREIVGRTVRRLQNYTATHTRLYIDFDPVNVVITRDSVGLLDPPEVHWVGPVHWDLATFAFGMRRSLWRTPWLGNRRRRSILATLIEEFFNAYSSARGITISAPDLLLIDLFQAVRLAQLWTWWKHPFRYRHSLRSALRAVYAYPLVRSERKQRFRRLRGRIEE
jgi:hypothetical protein